MLSSELEFCLNEAFQRAGDQRHEFMTVEHLLLALLDNNDAIRVLKACGADIGALRGGGEAWVELPDGDSLPAEQIRIFPYADPATHTFRVRMRLAAGQHGIYPGMWVKVSFHTGEDQVLPVPATAVITRSELTAVYVMGTDGAPRLRQVRLGRELPDGRVAVLAGLDPGERVVTDGDAARRALLDERR